MAGPAGRAAVVRRSLLASAAIDHHGQWRNPVLARPATGEPGALARARPGMACSAEPPDASPRWRHRASMDLACGFVTRGPRPQYSPLPVLGALGGGGGGGGGVHGCAQHGFSSSLSPLNALNLTVFFDGTWMTSRVLGFRACRAFWTRTFNEPSPGSTNSPSPVKLVFTISLSTSYARFTSAFLSPVCVAMVWTISFLSIKLSSAKTSILSEQHELPANHLGA